MSAFDKLEMRLKNQLLYSQELNVSKIVFLTINVINFKKNK